MSKELHDALENCLRLIQNGIEPEQALSLYPGLADELREPLVMGIRLAEMDAHGTHSQEAARSSRRKLLSRLETQRRRQPRIAFSWPWLRPAWALGAAITILAFSGVLTASAQALPGGALYPIKLAMERLRYTLTLSDQSQTELEAELRRERIYEAQALIEGGLHSSVSLQGQVDRISQSRIIVDGIPVQVPDDWDALETLEPGDWITVEGSTEDGIILASSARYIPATWTGLIESMGPSTWTIDGRTFIIGSATVGRQSFEIGDQVTVVISPDIQGEWRASSVIGLEEETMAEALADLAQEENERVAKWTGQIVSIHPSWIQIGQMTLRTGEWTELDSGLQPGYWVTVEARWDGDWWALEIEVVDELDFNLSPLHEIFEEDADEDEDDQEFEDPEEEDDREEEEDEEEQEEEGDD
jgi:hypothetical protein